MDTLDKHFRELTRAAFQRYGFAYGEVLARWPDIVGGALADCSRPERIKWPRGSGDEARKLGGTLVIAAAPGRALDLQYEVPRIIERINAFYGHGAIATVKVVQGTGFSTASPPRLKTSDNLNQNQELASIPDDGLRAALARLAQGIASRPHGSPQGK